MPGWNFADVWEDHADRFPDAPAQAHGEQRSTWREFDRRADGVAAALLDAGLGQQAKVAHYLTNCPEFLEAMFAMFKAGLVPVNTNYRYGDDELVYLWTNADVEAVVFHGTYAANVERIQSRVPAVRRWLWVDDGSGPCPDWAVAYEHAAASAAGRVQAPWGRSGDDLYLLYTGGTTGMPKGVMWRQDDIFVSLDAPVAPSAARAARPRRPAGEGDQARAGCGAGGAAHARHGRVQRARTSSRSRAPSSRWSAAPSTPSSCSTPSSGSRSGRSRSSATPSPSPSSRALDAEPDRWDVSSLRVMVSSGVMWSAETKQGLLRHIPRLMMLDSLGSSEAIGMATATTTAASTAERASETATLQAERLHPGAQRRGRRTSSRARARRGRVALKGRTPLGYYKDPEKSAATFVVVDGVRYSIPGDFAEVEADGTVKLLGRGSACINTGGEKVYPEEVEEVLKLHPDVADAVVVGVPDERFGEAVTAMVEAAPGAAVDEPALIAHVKSHLSHFKAPKRVHAVDTIGRAPNGKVDYRRLKAEAIARTS